MNFTISRISVYKEFRCRKGVVVPVHRIMTKIAQCLAEQKDLNKMLEKATFQVFNHPNPTTLAMHQEALKAINKINGGQSATPVNKIFKLSFFMLKTIENIDRRPSPQAPPTGCKTVPTTPSSASGSRTRSAARAPSTGRLMEGTMTQGMAVQPFLSVQRISL